MTSQNTTRSFEDKPATRERVPLLVGIMGPSGGGKTFSALRLASGIQRVAGGDIFVIDTESRRALHYADVFSFRHVVFSPPFSPLDYLEAIRHCVEKGAGTIIIDSMSHEHEGPGGVLEMHEAEVQRMSGGDFKKAERVKMLAWAKPKQQRRRLINTMLQFPVNFICCFRAKEKLKIIKGEEPKALGFMPIAGEEFVYEMTTNALLLPGAGGVPEWNPGEIGEKQMVKLPRQFVELFGRPGPLSEDMGEVLAKWASGETKSKFDELMTAIEAAADDAALDAVKAEMQKIPETKAVPPAQFKTLKKAYAERKEALDNATTETYDDESERGAIASEGAA